LPVSIKPFDNRYPECKITSVKKNYLRIIILSVIALGLVAGATLTLVEYFKNKTTEDTKTVERPVSQPKIKGPTGVVAKVGDIEVPLSVFSQLVNTTRQQALAEGTDIDDSKNASMLQAAREDALNQLVEYAVYENYAKKNGILPTSKEIDAAIASEIDARVHQAGSRQSLEKQLTDLGGIEGLKETIKGDPIFLRQVIRQKVSDNITKDLKVTKDQAKEFFESKLLGLSQIVVLYDEKIDGKELYEPTKKYAESLKAMIGKDKTFADVATMYSEDMESGQNGGRMSQLMPKGYLPPQMEKVAFSLKIGEISDVIEANGSFVILKLDYETYAWDYFFTDGGKKPKPNFEAVWKDVVNYLYTINKIEAENNWYQKYADSIKIDVYLEL